MEARVRAPGSCGELVQGTINGQNFLVSCPVNLYSYVRVRLIAQNSQLNCKGGGAKCKEAVKRTLEFFGRQELGALIEVNSELVVGKGMASSTADITAGILATALALGAEISLQQIAKLALSIEPSDAIFYEGIVLFDHLKGELYEYLGSISGLGILVLDLGGQVNTLDFNSRQDLAELNRLNEPLTTQALKLVKAGIRDSNPQLIGEGATLSSRANQVILPKQHFSQFLELRALKGVVGINVAHSGTLIGILYDRAQIEGSVLELQVQQQVGDFEIYDLKLINGGLEVIDDRLGREYSYG